MGEQGEGDAGGQEAEREGGLGAALTPLHHALAALERFVEPALGGGVDVRAALKGGHGGLPAESTGVLCGRPPGGPTLGETIAHEPHGGQAHMNPRLRAAAAALAAIAASCALATPAHAGVLTTSAKDCPDQELTQPFAPWLDEARYQLVDSFEGGAGDWTLTGGAKVVAGNEPSHVHAPGDSYSLALPAGAPPPRAPPAAAPAAAPPVCVGLDEPPLRYFASKDSGLLSTLAVSVLV